MSKRHQKKIRSSVTPDYSDLEDWLSALHEKHMQAEAYKDQLNELAALRQQELSGKHELITHSKIISFIAKRCKEKGMIFPTFPKGSKTAAFELDTDVDLMFMARYLDENAAQRDAAAAIFHDIGIPIVNIRGMKITTMHEGKQCDGSMIYLHLNMDTIRGLIEKAVEERFAPIEKRLNAVAAGQGDIAATARLIEKATGLAPIGAEVTADSAGNPATFREDEKKRIRNDIRRKVVDEILGSELMQKRDIGTP